MFDKELDEMQDIVIRLQNDNKMTENGKNVNKGETDSHNSAVNDTSSSNSDYDYLLDSDFNSEECSVSSGENCDFFPL